MKDMLVLDLERINNNQLMAKVPGVNRQKRKQNRLKSSLTLKKLTMFKPMKGIINIKTQNLSMVNLKLSKIQTWKVAIMLFNTIFK